jgi:hypothetical protein
VVRGNRCNAPRRWASAWTEAHDPVTRETATLKPWIAEALARLDPSDPFGVKCPSCGRPALDYLSGSPARSCAPASGTGRASPVGRIPHIPERG